MGTIMNTAIDSLDQLANGALNEKFSIEFQKVMANIWDLTTKPDAARKIALEIKLKPQKDRQIIAVEVNAKSTLAPSEPAIAMIFATLDHKNGEIRASEIGKDSAMEGQQTLDGETIERKRTVFEMKKGKKAE